MTHIRRKKIIHIGHLLILHNGQVSKALFIYGNCGTYVIDEYLDSQIWQYNSMYVMKQI